MAKIRQLALAAGAAVTLASCGPQGGLNLNNFDPDLRGWGGGGLDTAGAAAQAAPRPTPDQRGVISYPGYQVVIATAGGHGRHRRRAAGPECRRTGTL